MKKKYIKPEIEVQMIAPSEIICLSVKGGDTGIGGGGGGFNSGGVVRSPFQQDWDEDFTDYDNIMF